MAGTVGEVAGGVTLEVMIVGGGKAWVLLSEDVWTITWAILGGMTGMESEAVDDVEGLCSCL